MRYTNKPTHYQHLARYLIRLYPATWRERYAEEMLLILEESPPTLITLFNLLISLIDASLHRTLVKERNPHMLQRMRSNELIIYGATVIFLLTWYTSMISTSAYSMYVYNNMHYLPPPILGSIMHSIIYLLLAFILFGGLPILLSACWKALRARRFRALLLCLLGVVSPFVSLFLAVILPLLFERITSINLSLWGTELLAFFGIDISLTIIFFATQRIAPSRFVTHSALYLAALLPLVMLVALVVLSFWILPYITASILLQGANTYLLRQGFLLFVMIIAFFFCLISLLKSFQVRWGAQSSSQEEMIMEPPMMQ